MPSATENKQIKRKRILETAAELFMQKSVDSTAIDDVVKAAGVAKGTFYLYFKDKYDLLDQLLIQKSAGILLEAFNSIQDFESAEPEYIAVDIINYIIDYLCANRELTALLQKNLSHCLRDIMKEDVSELKTAVDSFVYKLIKKGYTKEEARKTLYIITDLTGSVCCDAIVLQKPYGIEEIRETLCQTVIKIIAKGGEKQND